MPLNKCPSCNRVITDTSEKCPYCGYQVKPKSYYDSEKTKNITGRIIFSVIIIIGLVVVIVSITKSHRKSLEIAKKLKRQKRRYFLSPKDFITVVPIRMLK